MKVAIHQPEHLPWLGFFYKMSLSDVLILLDDTQFQKEGFQNRNRIKTKEGWQWSTIPVLKDSFQPINTIKINNKVNWRRKNVEAIKANYAKAPFFKMYFPMVESIYQQEWNSLCELNCAIITALAKELGITTKVVLSSHLAAEGSRNEKLLNLCKKVNATTYICGQGAAEYFDEKLFSTSNIKVEYSQFQHPHYNQLHGQFVPAMSALDLLMNHGPEGKKILLEVKLKI